MVLCSGYFDSYRVLTGGIIVVLDPNDFDFVLDGNPGFSRTSTDGKKGIQINLHDISHFV
jgi:hypothetical protein